MENISYVLFVHKDSKPCKVTIDWIITNIHTFRVRCKFIQDKRSLSILKEKDNKIKINVVPTLVISRNNSFDIIEGQYEITKFLYSLEVANIDKYYQQQELAKQGTSKINFTEETTIIPLTEINQEVEKEIEPEPKQQSAPSTEPLKISDQVRIQEMEKEKSHKYFQNLINKNE